MPRRPAQDYADRCAAVELQNQGMTQPEIANAVHRSERWVRRTLKRYDAQLGLESLRDRSSRPHHSPNATPSDIEQAVCELKQAHSGWGRRQITKQLRWRWREDPARQRWPGQKRIRGVLARHPDLAPAAPRQERPPRREIDYLQCNLLWAADIHDTRLPDGTTWQTLHWIDLHSRFELGQVTAPCLTEALVIASFLDTARRYGLPALVKTDADKLWYDANSGLPSRLTRVLQALGIHHLIIKGQPQWNGVVERYIQTCRQEVHLPTLGEAESMSQAMESERRFYNEERCHSRCDDQPPITVYQPSSRRLPPDFDPDQVPITQQPTVVTRQVQASGRLSLVGSSYYFSARYAGQAVAVTVDGWSATARAEDGWQRTWDLHPKAKQPPADPLPPPVPKPLSRKVSRRGTICLSGYLYYIGIAWIGQTLKIERQADAWLVSLPDGSTKGLPLKHLLPQLSRRSRAAQPATPPTRPPEAATLQTRRVTQNGQVSFHHRMYYAGIVHTGETVYVAPLPEGLSVYTLERAWITICPWKDTRHPVEPMGPT